MNRTQTKLDALTSQDRSVRESHRPATVSKCPACCSQETVSFYSADGFPVHVGHFYDDPKTSSEVDRGAITLAYCPRCTHVFNCSFEADKLAYRPGYEVALHHSPTFCRFINGVADRLISRFSLKGKTIFEIGAGDAYFLRQLCSRGGNRGYGVDPTIATEGRFDAEPGSIELFRTPFDASLEGLFKRVDPDFVCCLSVLEHIPEPYGMLLDLRRMIGDRPVAVYFEIFNGERALKAGEVWSIHYEQSNYFSETSFADLFRRTGFEVLDSGGCYSEDQYLFVEARGGSAPAAEEPLAPNLPEAGLPPNLTAFSEKLEQRLAFWRKRLAEAKRDGEQVVFWGTGGKGVTFLNLLRDTEAIQYAAENNRAKQGKFVPGTTVRILAPDELRNLRPDEIIVSNAIYLDEIRTQVESMDIRCRFSVA